MVRPMTAKRTLAWKALAAIVIAGGGLLWHLLACIESPMAFSPNGRQLAFVTMDPYDEKDMAIRGTHAYRLFVLDDQSKLRLLEQSTDYMLTAPGFSPDGKRLYYLRIPLLSAEQSERIGESIKRRTELHRQATQPAEQEPWPAGPEERANPPGSAPAPRHEDLTLPSVSGMTDFLAATQSGPFVPAELVVRDIQRNEVLKRDRVDVPLSPAEDDLNAILMFTYLLTRTQVADGEGRVLVCTNDAVVAVDTSTGTQSVLAAPAGVSALSPDGKTLAVLQEKSVAFIQTDGGKALYVRYEREPSLSGLAWADGRTVAILRDYRGDGNEALAVLDLVRSDGTVIGSKPLRIEGQNDKDKSGELAISPDGAHMVVSFGSNVYFMTAEGKVLKSWSQDGYLMVQPAFSPDSKLVAFKFMGEEEKRVTGIVFYSPQGERKDVVAVPAIAPGTTRPASEPASGPG